MIDLSKRDRISYSLLSQYNAAIHGESRKIKEDKLRFGRGFHKALLEPDKFDWRDYTGKERQQFIKMQKAFNKQVPDSYRYGKKEQVIEYEFKGWRCMLKADIIDGDRSGVITDIKTTSKRDNSEFYRSMIEVNYHVQAAFYLDCPLITDLIDVFRIIAITKDKDPTVFIYDFNRDDALIQEGRKDYNFLLDCMSQDKNFQKFKAL